MPRPALVSGAARRLIAPLVGLTTIVSAPGAPRAQAPIFHPLEGRADHCLTCHATGRAGAPALAARHVAAAEEACLSCHARPGGSAGRLYGSFLPFAVLLVVGLLRTFRRLGGRRRGDRLT